AAPSTARPAPSDRSSAPRERRPGKRRSGGVSRASCGPPRGPTVPAPQAPGSPGGTPRKRKRRHRRAAEAPAGRTERARRAVERHDGSSVTLEDGGRARCGGMGCSGTLDLAGLEAGGAHVQPLRRAAHAGADGLDVRVPAAAGTAVRVRDTVPEPWSLAADVTDGSHGNSIHALGPGCARTHVDDPREV